MRALLVAALAAGAVLTGPPVAAAAFQAGVPGAQGGQDVEVLAEIRVHGNHTTPDADVLGLCGLVVGQPIPQARIDEAVRRLRASRRFEAVEVRKRYRSLTDTSQVALVIIVREHPVPDQSLDQVPAPLRPFRRLFASGMFLPIVHYTDGYGFTYGARFTFVGAAGRDSRVSVPLTWGGTKRVAIEAERTLKKGPFDRLTATAGLWRRENPHFDRDEDRREIGVGASRSFAGVVRAGLQAGLAHVSFGAIDERLASYGAQVSLDTRHDPVFPRNAVYATAGWTRLSPSISAPANTWHADLRAYRGVVGQSVLSVRWQYVGADGPVPDYERPLLGGAASLRGYRAGRFAGDNLMAGTVELRVPISSPMGVSRVGVSLFTDVGAAWNHGARLRDARVRRGVGGGVFLLASVFQLSLDVAVRQGGGVRAHFSTGLQF